MIFSDFQIVNGRTQRNGYDHLFAKHSCQASISDTRDAMPLQFSVRALNHVCSESEQLRLLYCRVDNGKANLGTSFELF